MGGTRIAVVLVAVGLAVYTAPAFAQPDEEIEMEPDVGSGSAKKPDPKPEPKKQPDPKPPDTKPEPDVPPVNAVVKDPKAAKKWLATAQQLVAKGDYFTSRKKPDDAKIQYENALTAYQKAIELGDDIIAVYFELANVEDKLGKFDEAAKHWRMVVKGQGVKPDVVKKATARFDDALTKLGLVTLTVQPEGTSITFAGAEIGKAPLPEPLILLPGTYLFSFTSDGFQPKETEVKVEAGSESERSIELEAVKIIIEPPRPKEPDLEPEIVQKPPSKLPLYIGGGAAVALTGVAAITGILAVGKHGTFTDSGSSAGDRDDAQSSGKSLARLTDVAIIGALGAGAFTAYWYFVKYKPAQRKFATESPKVVVSPWVQPSSGGGLSVVGAF